MADFTTIPKNRINWVAPLPTGGSEVEYTFKIDDTYFLDIGEGFQLIIQPADTDIDWTTTAKNRINFPSPIVETEYNLDIGSGFNLLIDDTYKFIIEDGTRSETPWTPLTRNKTTY